MDSIRWDDHQGLLAAARAIRPFLPDLVGPAADDLDARLGNLLAAADRGEEVVGPLTSLLVSHQATVDFVTEVLADAPRYRLPPELRAEGLVIRDVGPGFEERELLDPGTARRATRPLADPVDQAAESGRPVTLDGADPDRRFFLADLEDRQTPLRKGGWYTIAFSVGPSAVGSFAHAPFPDGVLATADQDIEIFELTVQLDSDDFEIYGESVASLRVPRTGRSLGKARFDIAPRHDGPCRLTATVHFRGNFLHQMKLAIPVGSAMAALVQVTTRGRPLDTAARLEPRPFTILLEPAPAGGFECTTLKSVKKHTILPITTEELTRRVNEARKAMLEVITSDYDGVRVFQDGLDIPGEARAAALRTLADAGALLFQKLFEHPAAGQDARAIGEWLRSNAMAPGRRLTIQVAADHAPLPWAMLYLGDVSDNAELDWNNFLGMRHIVEQIPLQMSGGADDSEIHSSPALTVSINVNPTIDRSMGITLVADHLRYWDDTVVGRTGLTLIRRSTIDEVVRALADGGTSDQVVYFYCHATAGGNDNRDPSAAAIVMGRNDGVTVDYLNLKASDKIKLAGNPLVFMNACESAGLSPLFYDGFVPYFMAKGARGVIGTECKTPVLFAIEWANAFFREFLDGAPVGETVLKLRQDFLREHGNPLGLIYAVHCSADTRIVPGLAHARP